MIKSCSSNISLVSYVKPFRYFYVISSDGVCWAKSSRKRRFAKSVCSIIWKLKERLQCRRSGGILNLKLFMRVGGWAGENSCNWLSYRQSLAPSLSQLKKTRITVGRYMEIKVRAVYFWCINLILDSVSIFDQPINPLQPVWLLTLTHRLIRNLFSLTNARLPTKIPGNHQSNRLTSSLSNCTYRKKRSIRMLRHTVCAISYFFCLFFKRINGPPGAV